MYARMGTINTNEASPSANQTYNTVVVGFVTPTTTVMTISDDNYGGSMKTSHKDWSEFKGGAACKIREGGDAGIEGCKDKGNLF